MSLAWLVLVIVVILRCIVIHERAIVVAACISGYGYLLKVLRRVFGEMRYNIWVPNCRRRLWVR
jgi:hypothetical protein